MRHIKYITIVYTIQTVLEELFPIPKLLIQIELIPIYVSMSLNSATCSRPLDSISKKIQSKIKIVRLISNINSKARIFSYTYRVTQRISNPHKVPGMEVLKITKRLKIKKNRLNKNSQDRWLKWPLKKETNKINASAAMMDYYNLNFCLLCALYGHFALTEESKVTPSTAYTHCMELFDSKFALSSHSSLSHTHTRTHTHIHVIESHFSSIY